ncbi:hypothetical protein ATANTOWER_025195 [Ataeniobius toweri]|uniref:Uncharacterized protein n=1 Tax=Ataeniobius toweri TaxID=208326 RepID=A0ABU7BB47_9TELE|nr:hypothetical protein [Ataeniobius toweri]
MSGHGAEHRSTSRFAAHAPCPACPPSNTTHLLEEPGQTAHRPVNLSLHGLLTSSRNIYIHLQFADLLRPDSCWILNQPIFSINLLNFILSACLH